MPPTDLLFPPVAACLLLRLSETLTENKVIEILRELRGGGAIQTVKVRTGSNAFQIRLRGGGKTFRSPPLTCTFPLQQYNFLHEFREKYSAYLERRQASPERSVSR